MAVIQHERCQRPVGQGFFHTGEVVVGKARFTYVYDCGSENPEALGVQIKEYCQTLNSARDVNALFISHLDADHVNGLDHLLEATHVHTVVLPYLPPCERLLLATEAEVTGKTTDTLAAALVDPTPWLDSRGVRRIIYVSSDAELPEGGTGLPEPSPEPPEGADAIVMALPASASSSGETIGGREGPMVEVLALDRSPLRLEACGGGQILNWFFLTHVYPEGERVSAFQCEVEKLFGSIPAPGTCSGARCASWATDIMRDGANRQALANCYKAIRSNRNYTSMCLYSGPIRLTGQELVQYVRYPRSAPPSPWWTTPDTSAASYQSSSGVRGAWLGTGDANLLCSARRQAFLRHYRELLPYVSTMALPHHGSRHNFGLALLEEGIPVFSVSVGGGKGQKHPDEAVEKAVQHPLRTFAVVTEQPDTALIEQCKL